MGDTILLFPRELSVSRNHLNISEAYSAQV